MLINDMRAFSIMAETGYPVCYDATHSIQMPTSMGNISGGQREYIPHLTRAAAATGIDAMFMEVHDDPPNALSDSNTVLDVKYFEVVLAQAKAIHDARRELKQNGEKTMSIQNNMTVGDVMLDLNATPQTNRTTMLKEALELMDQHKLGIVCITSGDGALDGIITDGDIRRMLNAVQKPIAALMSDDVINHAVRAPLTVTSATTLTTAITIMGNKKVWDLPVVDNDKLSGLLHLHPAIEALLAQK